MKFVTLDQSKKGKAGVFLNDGNIVNLEQAANLAGLDESGVYASVRGILEEDLIGKVRDLLAGVEDGSQNLRSQLEASGGIVSADNAGFLAPIPDPSLILAQGLAYRKHLDEMGVPLPKEPAALIKVTSSITGPGKPIVLPKDHPDKVDYEGEFCVVIGKTCHNIRPEEVSDYIAGYTIINDVSARDWVDAALEPGQKQMEAVLSWNKNIQGKQFPTFTPMGPVMVTKDEIADHHNLELTTRLNGEIMQSTNTDNLIFRIEDFIAYYSQWYQFNPGDVITTGTPDGVGQGRNPKVYMKEGDVIEITVSGVGTLTNHIVKW